MELRGRWWNGELSRNTRRGIWLKRDHVWRVDARQGNGHAHVWTHDYPNEDDARAAIAAMIERTGGSDRWEEFATEPDQPRSNGPATGEQPRPARVANGRGRAHDHALTGQVRHMTNADHGHPN
jgi:hypothetical protein